MIHRAKLFIFDGLFLERLYRNVVIFMAAVMSAVVITAVMGAAVFQVAITELADKSLEINDTVYSYSFPYPAITKELDISREPKAWIGYDGSSFNEPSSGVYKILDPAYRNLEDVKNALPNHIIAQESANRYPILAQILADHKSRWISIDEARSLVDYYRTEPYMIGAHYSCAQYKFVETYILAIPTSESNLAFLSIIKPSSDSSCSFDLGIEPISTGGTSTPGLVLILYNMCEFAYSNLLYLSITWTGLIGAVIWRGKTSKIWLINGLDYNQFVLMVKMRGSRTRLEILKILDTPKTRQLMAEELNLDWKTVHRHVRVLLRSELIQEISSVGQSTYYLRSENGNKLLNLLKNGYSSSYGESINDRMFAIVPSRM